MDRSRIQEAVSRILTSYLTSHKIATDQVPSLVTSVGQAFALGQPHVELDSDLEIVSRKPIHRARRQAKRLSEPNITRIEHPDQPDMFGVAEAELAEALIGESAGKPDTGEDPTSLSEDNVEADQDDRPRRGPRSNRAIAEADAETAIEDGVPVMRIPEVKRRKRA